MIKAGIRYVLAIAYIAAAVVLVTSCVAQSGTQPVLSSSDLVATWTSPDGGSITFTRNHRFTAAGLRLDRFWKGCAGVGRISASGTWQFLNSHGSSGLSPTGYAKGSLISLSFGGVADNPSLGCTGGGIELTSWNVGSTPGLCLQFDPDTPCDGYVFNRHGALG